MVSDVKRDINLLLNSILSYLTQTGVAYDENTEVKYQQT